MDNKTRTLIIGAVAGAALGLAGAFLLTRRSEETGTEITVSAGEGMRLGVMIVGLLRAVADLGEDKIQRNRLRERRNNAGTQTNMSLRFIYPVIFPFKSFPLNEPLSCKSARASSVLSQTFHNTTPRTWPSSR